MHEHLVWRMKPARQNTLRSKKTNSKLRATAPEWLTRKSKLMDGYVLSSQNVKSVADSLTDLIKIDEIN